MEVYLGLDIWISKLSYGEKQFEVSCHFNKNLVQELGGTENLLKKEHAWMKVGSPEWSSVTDSICIKGHPCYGLSYTFKSKSHTMWLNSMNTWFFWQVTGIPVVFTSALEGRGRIAVMHQVIDTYQKWCLRLPTSRLNRWLRKVSIKCLWLLAFPFLNTVSMWCWL